MKNGIIEINPKRCLACKGCEIACAVAHSSMKKIDCSIKETSLPEKRVHVVQRNAVAGIGGGFLKLSVPMQCRHCEDAPCVNICPVKALTKTETQGIVLLDTNLCNGCKLCIPACPFRVINLDRTGRAVIKCDMCIERLKQDELPACVSACPTNALKFRPFEEATGEKRKKYLVEMVRDKNT